LYCKFPTIKNNFFAEGDSEIVVVLGELNNERVVKGQVAGKKFMKNVSGR